MEKKDLSSPSTDPKYHRTSHLEKVAAKKMDIQDREKLSTLQPEVSKFINGCQSNRLDYRILALGEDETVEQLTRSTIVVDPEGHIVRKFYG